MPVKLRSFRELVGDKYMYNRSTLNGWMDYRMCLLASQIQTKHPLSEPNPIPQIWHYTDKRIPDWATSMLGEMGIEYVTIRPGEEANYLVLLTKQMELFHETYLIG